MSIDEINKRANRINVNAMTVNEHLYHAELINTFDKAIVDNKELAAQILKALKVDEQSIDQIVIK